MKRGAVSPKDFLAIIVILIGCLGFIIWGIGLSSIGNSTLKWMGGWIVALVGLLITFLSRWLK